MSDESTCFIFQKPNKYPNGYCEFKIDKDNIMIWLKFLKTNYHFYADIDIFDAKTCLDLIDANDTLYLYNSIRSM